LLNNILIYSKDFRLKIDVMQFVKLFMNEVLYFDFLGLLYRITKKLKTPQLYNY